MGGCPNKIGLHGHPLDTDVRVLKEPRTVPYSRIGSLERIRTVSVPYRPYLNGQPWLFRSSNHLLMMELVVWGSTSLKTARNQHDRKGPSRKAKAATLVEGQRSLPRYANSPELTQVKQFKRWCPL
jgi:hypothetical protein